MKLLRALLVGAVLVAAVRYVMGRPEPVRVMIRAGTILRVVPASVIGLNTAAWDSHLSDPTVPDLLRQAGVRTLRFPGGSFADIYHWQTNSVTPGEKGAPAPGATFDAFMALAKKCGAEPIVTVNYGSSITGGPGDPQEAAAWVRYANVIHNDRVRYWEIGNEVYGNGSIGAPWEVDRRPDKGPGAYAAHALEFIHAMKAVDPSIKVGISVVAPGAGRQQRRPVWNQAVFTGLGPLFDFVSVHWYPQEPYGESDAGLLRTPDAIPTMMDALKTQLTEALGASAASRIQILLTETNSVFGRPGKQTTSPINALFLMDDLISWAEAGATVAGWWDLHNGPQKQNNNNPKLMGARDWGDYGILTDGEAPEPRANTPLPVYAGMEMAAHLLASGSRLLQCVSNRASVRCHAAILPDGRMALLVINRGATSAVRVDPLMLGAGSVIEGHAVETTGPVEQYTYPAGRQQNELQVRRRSGGGQLHVVLDPYSAALVIFTPRTPLPLAGYTFGR